MTAGRRLDESRRPLLELEWHSDANDTQLGDFAPGSQEKTWWLCPLGHEYSRSIRSRFAGGDCSYCANDRVLAGFNDLESNFPKIASEWADSNDVAPSEVLSTSKKRYDWKCNLGHTWSDSVATRTVFDRNCQFCEDKKVWSGFNDLETVWPESVDFWSTKNAQSVSEVLWNERDFAHWECPLGHTWKSRIYLVLRDKSCPFCQDREPWPGFNTLEDTFPKLIPEFVSSEKGETDPSKILGRSSRVPMVWKCPEGHLEKRSPAAFRARFGCSFCRRKDPSAEWPTIKDDSRLFESWDQQANPGKDPSKIAATATDNFGWRCKLEHTWKASAYARFKYLNECPYCEGKKIWAGFNDLKTLFPSVAKEWSDENTISPNLVSPGNNGPFKWVCSHGHWWEASPSNRTRGRNGGTNCPVCTNRRVQSGFNDLATTHPMLAQQWDFERNEGLTPEQVLFKRKDSCWWKCALGHFWSCPPRSRYRGNKLMGCPYCGRQKLLKGFNDLKSRRPDLMTWWNFNKNDVAPEDVLTSKDDLFWWTCPEGHDFESGIIARSQSKNNCPDCAPPVSITTAQLIELNLPKLSSEWDLGRNGKSLDEALASSKTEKFDWICSENGHPFRQRLTKRIAGQNCPYCSGKAVLLGYNDLVTRRPDIAASWDYEKNGDALPQHFTQNSGKRFWWACDKGHQSWKTSIAHRSNRRSCPGCKKTGFNPSEPGYLYWLRNDQWQLFKIGITNNPSQRLAQHALNGWEALEVEGPMDGYFTQELEADLLSTIERRTQTLGQETSFGKFDGYTECWSFEDFVIYSLADLRQLLYLDESASNEED